MKKFALLLPAFLPVFAFAQIRNITDVGSFIIDIINNLLVPVLFAGAFLYFIWGVFQSFFMGKEEKDRKAGQQKIIWGLVAFFVMVSVWGLVNILVNSVDLDSAQPSFPAIDPRR
jgi:hypothetical protein